MTSPLVSLTEPDLEYPDRDGQPMSDNTLQFQWIVTLQGNIDALFSQDVNVFVGGDLLWYPVQGSPTVRTAPDVMVAFGRPKGHRGSYKQWLEGGIPPQVVFEVQSPGNRPDELQRKFDFYQRFGVEEYYLFDPMDVRLSGWVRQEDRLVPIARMDGWVSPRLRIRFDLSGDDLAIYRPDDRPFLTFAELMRQKLEAETATERERVAKEQERAAKERERLSKEQAQQLAERLAAKLRELGVDPDASHL
jgi:Uma2 family endonuclease